MAAYNEVMVLTLCEAAGTEPMETQPQGRPVPGLWEAAEARALLNGIAAPTLKEHGGWHCRSVLD